MMANSSHNDDVNIDNSCALLRVQLNILFDYPIRQIASQATSVTTETTFIFCLNGIC